MGKKAKDKLNEEKKEVTEEKIEKVETEEVKEEQVEEKTKKKGKRIILKIILIVLLVFVLLTIRKVLIIMGLQERASLYATNVNYYYKIVDGRNEITTVTYYKDGVKKQSVYKDDELKFTQVEYEDEIKTFTENEGKITMTTSAKVKEGTKLPNMVETDNIGFTIINALASNIKTEEVNGKECYVITGFNANYLYETNTEKAIAYVEKNTGLVIKFVEVANESGELVEYVTTYDYEFGKVQNVDIAEPIIED